MNRAIDTSSPEERRVCGVHNRIDIELRNVAANNLDFASRGLHESLPLQ
jgi:hypothetical protein